MIIIPGTGWDPLEFEYNCLEVKHAKISFRGPANKRGGGAGHQEKITFFEDLKIKEIFVWVIFRGFYPNLAFLDGWIRIRYPHITAD